MKQYLYHRSKFIIPLLILFLILQFPASFILKFVPAPVQSGGVSGTIWSGRLTPLGISGQQLLDEVRWQWQPLKLFKGQLVWQLDTRYGSQAGKAWLALGVGGNRLESVSLTLPAAPLFALDKKLAPFQLGGQLTLEASRISKPQTSEISLLWQNASSLVTPQANPFGSYQIKLQPDLNWTISPVGGAALAISGQGKVDPQRGPQGSLQLKAASGKESLFAPLLDRMPLNGDQRELKLGI
ncbi:type II secretion system protein N [Iodobacter fluviatilis]|uniref:Type II secretion system protein N n=1 Tax=Iodobacter fluviatilis TaxID=537 RepID=A0A377QA52_9NEIS|nr:type II secretion system protein N [Iodobacter fluviatilis]TCU83690.1 type II secretion system protein N (GspN) [Iodobacter fluviatilis]STQ91803.1 Bacterial type II secretion system protein N [Iodobacter fluviatilis]